MLNTFMTQWFQILNRDFEYAILRNHEGLPEQITSRDIDILVARKQLKKLQSALEELLAETGGKILYLDADNQFWTAVIGFVNGTKVELVQLDIMSNLSVKGVNLLEETQVLSERLFNGKVYYLPLKYVFLSKYVYLRLLNARYPDKYQHILDEVKAGDFAAADAELARLIGCPDGGYALWETLSSRKLYVRCFKAALIRDFWGQSKQSIDYLRHSLRHLFCRRGLSVSFTGPDGSGKTTVIELLIKHLQVNPPVLFHFRPTLLPNLGEVGAKAGVVKEVDRNFDRPHRGKSNNPLNSLLRLGFYMCDYIGGYYVKIMPLRYRKHIVFFDRHFTDMIADGERSSIFLDFRWICALRTLVPRCQYNFLFRVAPERILSRKQELTMAAIQKIYTRLDYLQQRDRRYDWIDNNGTPQEAAAQIMTVLLTRQHQKYVRKLQS